MTLRVTKRMTREELNKALSELKVRKVLRAKKFCGIINWKTDGLKFQQQQRNEWN